MAANSSIEWTHHTFNLWHGCVKVSEGCRHCYAETWDDRHMRAPVSHWGKTAGRAFASERYLKQPLTWNRKAQAAGQRARVFCMSMGDLFERHAIPYYAERQAAYRERLFDLIEQTPCLDWLLLSKRPEDMATMLPPAWLKQPQPNVWLGASIENQRTAATRLPVLLDTPARIHFASYEPALGPLDLEAAAHGRHIDWLIAGSESGPSARPAQLDWFRSARDQCLRLGVSFFFKQWVEGPRKKVKLPVLDGRRWQDVPTSCAAHLVGAA